MLSYARWYVLEIVTNLIIPRPIDKTKYNQTEAS